jgi:DNA gyrase subunit B
VALADGTCPTFRELAQRFGEFYVYSIGPEGVRISPAWNARVTMVATDLVEVLLDNFQVVRCTPEHLFMTLDRGWVQAQHLTPDVRLMPLYRTVAALGGTSGYERLWCPIRRGRFFTHRLAMGLPPNGTVVHHLDGDKTNNDPRNLVVMGRMDHHQHHGNDLWKQRRVAIRAGHLRYVEERGRRVLPERMEKMGENHRVLRVTRVAANEEVYDLSVPETENFALASGVFVHNSKDLSDALSGVVWGLRQHAARLPWTADADTPRKVVGHEHGWVSEMIPAEDVDIDEVRATQTATDPNVMLPFYIGDD